MVLKVLAKARLNKKTVKVVGNGHSPSDIACTRDYMISLKNFNKILEVRIVNALAHFLGHRRIRGQFLIAAIRRVSYTPILDTRHCSSRGSISTVQQDLKQHHLTLPEAADLAQNRPLWRMMSTYGATQSWVAHWGHFSRDRAIVWITNRNSYGIYPMVPFSMTLSDPYLDFKVMILFDVK